mmetsp:Transcript_88653/g.153882  ORF Transcript_88653/g.153882 Transcript_88653/m.153882 type:complete len:101 (-) Transcript_88653:134-436(-)
MHTTSPPPTACNCPMSHTHCSHIRIEAQELLHSGSAPRPYPSNQPGTCGSLYRFAGLRMIECSAGPTSQRSGWQPDWGWAVQNESCWWGWPSPGRQRGND